MEISKAALVERVESTLLACILGPRFTAIKQSAEHAGHLDFRGQRYSTPSWSIES